MINSRIGFINRIALIISVFLFNALLQQAFAVISGFHGIKYSSSGTVYCPTQQHSEEYAGFPKIDSGSYFKGNACSMNLSGYLPESGSYRIRVWVNTAGYVKSYALSSLVYIDATKNLSAQNLKVSGSNVNITGSGSPYFVPDYCYVLDGPQEGMTEQYLIEGSNCASHKPIPPSPPPPVINCTVNNSNAINVNLGTLDRALLPTVPGTGQPQTVQIPVSCTTDTASVTTLKVNMKLTYTPMTVSGLQVIKSSTNGMGVSVIYNNNVLPPSVDKPIDLNIGSNNITLGFEAVRDPTVELAKVPTGAFTASAVLVMTVQ